MEKRRKSKVVCKLMDVGMGSWSDDPSPPEQLSCLLTPQDLFQHETKSSFKFPPPPIVSGTHCSSSSNQHANSGAYDQLESDSSHCYTTGSMSDVEDNSDSQSECGKVPEYRRSRVRSPRMQQNLSYVPVSGSLSDTGFGTLRAKSSPISIHRPRCSMRGYDSDGSPISTRNVPRLLPPIGVFWDIENCQVPKGRSAVAVAQVIRDRFFEGFREAEFLVVCDVKKENSQVIQELNDAQVNLIHVASTCKNAADEKLRQSIRRFAEIYGSPAAIILISGDVNFAADLSDLRHRKKIHVILVHNSNTSDTLIMCANDHYNFSNLVEGLPLRGVVKPTNQSVEVVVSNLPSDKEPIRIKNRLKKLSDNCGGRVGTIVRDSALIRFPTYEFAIRAQKRMDGEDVFGNKITVSRPIRTVVKDQESPFKHSTEYQSRVRLNTYHSSEDYTANQSTTNSNFQFGLYFSKTTTTPSNNGTSVDMISPGISQFGHPPIGSPSYYRSVPPPAFSARTSVPPANQNGWNRVVSQSAPSNGTTQSLPQYTQNQSQQENSSFNMHKQVDRTGVVNPSTPPASQPWQTLDSTCPGTTPLDIASQSLSMLTASLSNFQPGGVTDFYSDGSRRQQNVRKAEGDGISWEESAASQSGGNPYTLKSRLPLATYRHSRSPSPATGSLLAPTSMQPASNSQILPFPGRSGAGDSLQWSGSQGENGVTGDGKSRTPSPYSMNGGANELTAALSGRHSWNRTSPYSDEGKDVSDRYFHPISVPGGSMSITPSGRGSSQGQPNNMVAVDLQVTNLDQNFEAKEMKKRLAHAFHEHVTVLHISVFAQSDGNLAATVRVRSLQDAQYAVSQLHRKKVGFKRIQISYTQSGPSVNPTLIRRQIVTLLQEVPGHCLPLFKFRELFERRYLVSISVSDMYKLRDVCVINEDPSGRMVSLNPDHRDTPSPLLPPIQDGQPPYNLPYCSQHYKKLNIENWAEQEPTALPNVRIGLKVLAQRIHGLIQSHGGRLPLPSLVYCYEAQYQQLEIDEGGVPLEHLVSCLPGVEMYQVAGSVVKFLRWAVKPDDSSQNDGSGSVSCVSPPLADQLALFSRELVDLLKTTPNCQLSFNRFIPAYHHHFGRQCRVAAYGFTKLIQLLEALPNIVQVLGEGSKRVVTLSHRAQVRRFTSDLLRVLKAQNSKQVTVSEFPAAYQRVLDRQFEVVNYGVCLLEDLLSEVSESTVTLTPTGSDVLIAIPKREQTPEEIEKTKQFAQEVLQLLRYAPQCSMNFGKFIPYYHHHFGKQCRVADYGFTKLIELFEAIPHIVEITKGEDERKVGLILEQRILVLGDQIATILKSSEQQVVPLNTVAVSFLRNYGYALRPEEFECSSLVELMDHIRHVVRVFHVGNKPHIALVDKRQLQTLGLLVRRVLWERPDCSMSGPEFVQIMAKCGEVVQLSTLQKDLPGVLQVSCSEGSVPLVRLAPLQVFARDVYNLLSTSDGSLPVETFQMLYVQKLNKSYAPSQYGFTSVKAMLAALPDVVTLQRNVLVLNSQLSKLRIPETDMKSVWTSNKNKTRDGSNFNNFSSDRDSSTSNETKSRKNQANSPDSFMKKIIRNLSNQASPSKRVCGENNGSTGYRPLGFGTSQQPLHGESFVWGYPHHRPAAFPSVAMPISPPPMLSPPLASPTQLFHGGDAASSSGAGAVGLAEYSAPAPAPLVVPPDPSELPMPHLTLVSPPSWSSTISNAGSREGRSADLPKGTSTASISEGISERSNTPQGRSSSNGLETDCNTSVEAAPDANTSTGSLKRKQRLAIQFNSPLIPIQ